MSWRGRTQADSMPPTASQLAWLCSLRGDAPPLRGIQASGSRPDDQREAGRPELDCSAAKRPRGQRAYETAEDEWGATLRYGAAPTGAGALHRLGSRGKPSRWPMSEALFCYDRISRASRGDVGQCLGAGAQANDAPVETTSDERLLASAIIRTCCTVTTGFKGLGLLVPRPCSSPTSACARAHRPSPPRRGP